MQFSLHAVRTCKSPLLSSLHFYVQSFLCPCSLHCYAHVQCPCYSFQFSFPCPVSSVSTQSSLLCARVVFIIVSSFHFCVRYLLPYPLFIAVLPLRVHFPIAVSSLHFCVQSPFLCPLSNCRVQSPFLCPVSILCLDSDDVSILHCCVQSTMCTLHFCVRSSLQRPVFLRFCSKRPFLCPCCVYFPMLCPSSITMSSLPYVQFPFPCPVPITVQNLSACPCPGSPFLCPLSTLCSLEC